MWEDHIDDYLEMKSLAEVVSNLESLEEANKPHLLTEWHLSLSGPHHLAYYCCDLSFIQAVYCFLLPLIFIKGAHSFLPSLS